MKLHAFVAMPFGTKPDAKGDMIDFNRVYKDLIKPALESAGLEPFRADEEKRAGDIRADMFQELLVADLVVVDLTIDNPNVWYELGVRHALRARGVLLICGGRVTTAFDIYTDRKLRYDIKNGVPDAATLEHDRHNLANMAKKTMESWQGRKVSPVYQLLPNLQEPDWKSLRVGDVKEFWEQHDTWVRRIDLARKAGHIGDILLLADEAPISAFRAEAWIKAGNALYKNGHFDFALEQFNRGLEIEPLNLEGLRGKGLCLQRLALAGVSGHSFDRARAHYEYVMEKYPNNPEVWAMLSRVYKDAWIVAWHQSDKTPEEWREEAKYEDALLRAAIDSYAKSYRNNTSHYYSGINALTLMHLHRYLTGDDRFDLDMPTMAGAVRFAAECEKNPNELFWSKATLGDLEVLVGTPGTVMAAYKEALTVNGKNWFALDSCCAQLRMLSDLNFRPETVKVGIDTLERAMQKIIKPEDGLKPRRVILFSGHMIDAPGRSAPRFPAGKETIAAQKIGEALDQLGAGSKDIAVTQGACGGDILFTEACQERGVKVHWLQPLSEPEFIQKSVVCSGEVWRGRYLTAKTKLTTVVRSAPEQLGPPPKGVDPFERCNAWLLYTALSHGIDKVHFICLWDGGGGDGPGGTAHMYQEVKAKTGQVTWLDTRVIW